MKQTIKPIHPPHVEDYQDVGLEIAMHENRPYAILAGEADAATYNVVKTLTNDTTELDDQIDRRGPSGCQHSFAAFRQSIGITKPVSIVGRWLHAITLTTGDFAPLQITKADYHCVICQRYGDLYQNAIEASWQPLPDTKPWWTPAPCQIPRVRFDAPKLPKHKPRKEIPQ